MRRLVTIMVACVAAVSFANAAFGDACCDNTTYVCTDEDQGTCEVHGTWHSGESCTAVEACCWEDGTCTMLDPLCCVDQGGTPAGSGTDCSGSLGACCWVEAEGEPPTYTYHCEVMNEDCCTGAFEGFFHALEDCDPTGGCCLDSGECIVTTEFCCSDFGGTYKGDDVACVTEEACCVEDPPGTWTCLDTDPWCCANHHSGTAQGGGSSCSPLEACCIEDTPGTWTCEMMDPECCDDAGGIAGGPDTLCTGACCLEGGSCVDETEDQCASRPGTWMGWCTWCAGDDPNGIDDVCETADGACCKDDGSCENMTLVECQVAPGGILEGGKFAGVGTGCAGDVDDNGIDDICEITEAVPAFTGPGLLLMAGLLVVAGVVILRRWRAQIA